ncbi:MAG: hypothetical protein DVB22_002996 [Verrucomicrobia bacterium]|nr:MAG: hypothetical protein DVB22_002996 [Verrucomicrobiota bacterium]
MPGRRREAARDFIFVRVRRLDEGDQMEESVSGMSVRETATGEVRRRMVS